MFNILSEEKTWIDDRASDINSLKIIFEVVWDKFDALKCEINSSTNPYFRITTNDSKSFYNFVKLTIQDSKANGSYLFPYGNNISSDITSGAIGKMCMTFKPELWEQIVMLKLSSNSKTDFINKLNEKYKKYNWFFLERMCYDNIVLNANCEEIYNGLYDNFHIAFSNNPKKNLMKFCLMGSSFGGISYNFNIFHKEINYPNKYFDNLEKDFSDWNKDITINLGLINDNIDSDIKNAVKQKYSNFDINQISIVDKVDYSHFCQCFSVKIKVKDNSEKYYHGILKNKFSYITQSKLNEISNYIANDSKVKQWISHINDYNKNLPTKIEHLKSYIDSKKWIEKSHEKEIIKGYIRDWSYVHTLIEHELKLDELNKNVQGLKSSFDIIKNQVNDLDERVNDLEQPNHCESKGNIVSSVSGVIALAPIPVLQQVAGGVSAISGAVVAFCGL